MMNEMKMNQMEALLNNEAFQDQVAEVSSKDELMELFRDNGIEISEEEFDALGQKGISILKETGHMSDDGELSAEMLDMVAGGGKIGKALLCFGLAAASAYCGCAEGAVIMIICGIAVLKSK